MDGSRIIRIQLCELITYPDGLCVIRVICETQISRLTMDLDEITYNIIGAAYNVHCELGPGLLEKIYEEALAYQLCEDGMQVETQVALPVFYRGHKLPSVYRLDLLVEDSVIVELKSVSTMTDLYRKQLLTYLKLTGKPVGLLMNFNVTNLRSGITRIVNNY